MKQDNKIKCRTPLESLGLVLISLFQATEPVGGYTIQLLLGTMICKLAGFGIFCSILLHGQGFPVVLWHYRLSGRKDIWLIKIQLLFQ